MIKVLKNDKVKNKAKLPTRGAQYVTKRQVFAFVFVPLWLFVLTMAVFGVLFVKEYLKHLDDPSTIRHLIIKASEGVSTEAPLVATADRQYIPEMKLSFDRTSVKLAYSHSPADENTPEIAIITSVQIKSAASASLYSYPDTEGLFKNLEAYQRCQRPFILTKVDQEPGYYANYQKLETLQTSASPLYIWQTRDSLCQAADGSFLSELLETLRSAQSY